MEGTTGQKRRPKQTQKNIQTLDRAAGQSGGPRRLLHGLGSNQASILSNPNDVPGSGTINKERMEQFQFGILMNALLQRILEVSDPVSVERPR